MAGAVRLVTSLGEVDVVVLGAGLVGCCFAALVTRVRPELTVALAARDSILGDTNTQLSLGVDAPPRVDTHHGEFAVDSAQARTILTEVCPSLRGRPRNAVRMVAGASTEPVVHDLPVVVTMPEEVVAQLAGWVHVCGSGVVHGNFDVAAWERKADRIRVTDRQGRTLVCRYLFVALGGGLPTSPFADLAPPGLDRIRVAAARLRIESLRWGGAYLFESASSFLVSAEQPGTFWMPLDGTTRLTGAEVTGGLSVDDHRELDHTRSEYLRGAEVEVLEHRAGMDLYAPPSTPLVVRLSDNVAVATGCGGSGVRLAPGVARTASRLLGLT